MSRIFDRLRESWLLGLVRTDRTLQVLLVGIVVLLGLAVWTDKPSCWVPVSELDHETRILAGPDGTEVEALYVRISLDECP